VGLVDEHVVVLVTGISAAGKSTVAELLARRFQRGVHVKGDVFRRMVVAGREDMTAVPSDEARRQLRLRYRLGAATTDAYFEQSFSVVVQDVVIGPLLVEYVEGIRSRPLIVVVLAPRAEVVALREAERSKVGYRDGHNSINQLDAALRHETPRVGLWLDTSVQTPEQTVDEIVTRGRLEGLISSQ
jgi:chloramphenicol 3-O-phosphotransferase